MEFEERPKLEDAEPQSAQRAQNLNADNLENDLLGAVEAVGPEEVASALREAEAGVASPAVLLDWIDDLRDPDATQHVDEVGQTGIVPDFIADTEFAGGAVEVPTAVGGDDADYFFAASRKRRIENEEEDEPPPSGGGGGGEGGGGAGGAGAGGAAATGTSSRPPASPSPSPKPSPPAPRPPKKG